MTCIEAEAAATPFSPRQALPTGNDRPFLVDCVPDLRLDALAQQSSGPLRSFTTVKNFPSTKAGRAWDSVQFPQSTPLDSSLSFRRRGKKPLKRLETPSKEDMRAVAKHSLFEAVVRSLSFWLTMTRIWEEKGLSPLRKDMIERRWKCVKAKKPWERPEARRA